jgi:hypothetical protein
MGFSHPTKLVLNQILYETKQNGTTVDMVNHLGQAHQAPIPK